MKAAAIVKGSDLFIFFQLSLFFYLIFYFIISNHIKRYIAMMRQHVPSVLESFDQDHDRGEGKSGNDGTRGCGSGSRGVVRVGALAVVAPLPREITVGIAMR